MQIWKGLRNPITLAGIARRQPRARTCLLQDGIDGFFKMKNTWVYRLGMHKSKIDKLWEEFWTGGITNSVTVIEQISF